MRKFFIVILLCLPFSQLIADELKPAYAELTEYAPNTWRVTWKVSEVSILGQIGVLELPASCEEIGQVITRRDGGNLIRTSNLFCAQELWGQSIRIQGLERTNTDALIRLSSLNGHQTLRLTSEKFEALIVRPKENLISNIAYTYTVLGIEHILQGYDHLLFVIAMVLLVTGFKQIALTITAFTVAHSITLIGNTFGYLVLPQRPVEAVIALSIVFLAVELIKRKAGQFRLSETYPWLIAFMFGLLHGLGFAGALAEIGLPKIDFPLALLMFNLGVELGQIVIVSVTLSVLFLIQRITPRATAMFKFCCAYFIGITSTFWLIERVVS